MTFVLLTIAGLVIIVTVAVPIYFAWVALDNVRAKFANAKAIHRAATARKEKAKLPHSM